MYRVGICRGGATVTLGCWRARDGCRHDARWTRLSQIEATSRSGWSCFAATCHAWICWECANEDACGRLGREQSSWVIGKVKSMGKGRVEHRPEQACRRPPSVHGLEGKMPFVSPSSHLPTITPLTMYVGILSSHTRNATAHVYLRASITAKADFRILGSANVILARIGASTNGERLLV
jgi:hypothetical protein